MGERKGLRLEEINSAMLDEVKSYSSSLKANENITAIKEKTTISVHIDSDLALAIRMLRLRNRCNLSELINKNIGQIIIDEIGRNNISTDILEVLEK